MECVKLHHNNYGERSHKAWYICYIPQFSVLYQLYTTIFRVISVIYHSAALLISTTGVVYKCIYFNYSYMIFY